MHPPKRIGVFGGAFDPPHNTHAALIELALVQLQLDPMRVVQRCVGGVRRIERAAKHANAFWRMHQTQFLGVRNFVYSSSSGVPGSGRCW